MLTLHKESHLDHGLTAEQIAYLLDLFKTRDAFFIETVTLPSHLGTVPCGLHLDVPESEVVYMKRPPREHDSRMCNRPKRDVREVTVVAGPHDGEACIVYTIYGGPQAPQEPGDPQCKDINASKVFWLKAALSREGT